MFFKIVVLKNFANFIGKHLCWSPFFFIRVFFHGHWQLTAQQGKGRDHLIPLYHFHQLTNIQTFICNFAREMTITYFQSQRLCLPGCYSMRFITLSSYYLIDWWCNFDCYLFACWIDFRFCYSYRTWETGGLELASTIILVLQANQLTKCASG